MKAPLIVILGPTAVGKTELSLQLAERLNGEIVSADSRLFYRGMDIGTAKPTPEERARVPHHLVDVVEPDETWSLTVFQKAAHEAIADIHRRGKLPFLVGGTGQYLRAIYEGWLPPAQQPNLRLREVLETWGKALGPQNLHARLAHIDPQAAARIQPNNLRRTVRALEVIFMTGRLFSAQQHRGEPPYRTLLIGLTRPRQELYARIDARIQAMLDMGLVDEVRALLARGYSPELPAMSAIGYKQIAAYLQGAYSLEDAVTLIKRLTRQFVRRQANWFKADDPQIHWFSMDNDPLSQIESTIRAFLS